MIGSVCEEISVRFVEDRCSSSVTFGQDDLIEEHNRGVIWRFSLAFMDKLIETCEKRQITLSEIRKPRCSLFLTLGLLQYIHVIGILMRKAP